MICRERSRNEAAAGEREGGGAGGAYPIGYYAEHVGRIPIGIQSPI